MGDAGVGGGVRNCPMHCWSNQFAGISTLSQEEEVTSDLEALEHVGMHTARSGKNIWVKMMEHNLTYRLQKLVQKTSKEQKT